MYLAVVRGLSRLATPTVPGTRSQAPAVYAGSAYRHAYEDVLEQRNRAPERASPETLRILVEAERRRTDENDDPNPCA